MLQLNTDYKVSKVKQIVAYITKDIEKGILKKDTKLPSINEFSEQYSVARDTIEKAYKELKQQDYIISVIGKGFFVKGRKDKKINILLVFNELSSYKKILYDNFIQAIGNKANVDLQFHHYNPQHLNAILDRNLGLYHYYIVMPHFFHTSKRSECLQVLNRIPANELMLLDKYLPEVEPDVMGVFQVFDDDIFNALVSIDDLLKKYKNVRVVFPTHTNYPLEALEGIKKYCVKSSIKFSLIKDIKKEEMLGGTVYMVNVESDLAEIIKKIRQSDLQLGVNVGIISFNETVLKELLDITVVTTNFEHMGRCAAEMILSKKVTQVKIPFAVIRRKSI